VCAKTTLTKCDIEKRAFTIDRMLMYGCNEIDKVLSTVNEDELVNEVRNIRNYYTEHIAKKTGKVAENCEKIIVLFNKLYGEMYAYVFLKLVDAKYPAKKNVKRKIRRTLRKLMKVFEEITTS